VETAVVHWWSGEADPELEDPELE